MSEQHLEALENANRIRLARAQIKRELRAGKISVADALLAESMQSMQVASMLKALPRWGDKKAFWTMKHASVADGCPIGRLTERQRDAIVQSVARNARPF